MDTRTENMTIESLNADRLERSVERIAEQFEALAVAVRHHKTRVSQVGTTGVPTYTSVVGSIQSQVSSAVANLALDVLLDVSIEADLDRAATTVRRETAAAAAGVGGYEI